MVLLALQVGGLFPINCQVDNPHYESAESSVTRLLHMLIGCRNKQCIVKKIFFLDCRDIPDAPFVQ